MNIRVLIDFKEYNVVVKHGATIDDVAKMLRKKHPMNGICASLYQADYSAHFEPGRRAPACPWDHKTKTEIYFHHRKTIAVQIDNYAVKMQVFSRFATLETIAACNKVSYNTHVARMWEGPPESWRSQAIFRASWRNFVPRGTLCIHFQKK